MRRTAATFVMVLVATGFVLADLRTDEKSQVKFEGTLSRMVNFFGGKGAREGIVSTVAVKGNRKMMTTDKTAQLVDLAEEKVYELDLDKKSYTVMTFAEIRRQMEEARRKAAQQAQQAQQAPKEKEQAAAPSDQNPQIEIDFDLKESGQKKAINGFDAREVVMTVSVHEKGKPIAQNGGMVLSSSNVADAESRQRSGNRGLRSSLRRKTGAVHHGRCAADGGGSGDVSDDGGRDETYAGRKRSPRRHPSADGDEV